MKVIGILPARLHSTRLPRKLLLQETGKTVLQHTWERATQCSLLDELVIATDSEEIAAAGRAFSGNIVMTGECANGTERAAAAIQQLSNSYDLVVNVQADEPEIDPQAISKCIQALQKHSDCEMATLANPITSYDQLISPACVKVVCAANSRALYFSRSAIPFSRDLPAADWLAEPQAYQPTPWLQHIGLYAYRKDFLLAFVRMPPSQLELIEQLEQLRALQAGAGIHVTVVPDRSAGIDTPEDYQQFVQRFRESPVTS